MSRHRTMGPCVLPVGRQMAISIVGAPGENVPEQVRFYTAGQNVLVEDIISANWSHFAMPGAVNSELLEGLPLWLRSLEGSKSIAFHLRNPKDFDLPVTVYVDFAEPNAQARRLTYLCPFQPSPEEGSDRKLLIARTGVGGRLKELRMMPDCRRHLGRELKVEVSTYDTKPDDEGELDGTRDLYSLKATKEGNMFGPSALVRQDAIIELSVDDDEFWRDVRPDDFMVVIEHDRHL